MFCLKAKASGFVAIANKSGDNRHPCLVPCWSSKYEDKLLLVWTAALRDVYKIFIFYMRTKSKLSAEKVAPLHLVKYLLSIKWEHHLWYTGWRGAIKDVQMVSDVKKNNNKKLAFFNKTLLFWGVKRLPHAWLVVGSSMRKIPRKLLTTKGRVDLNFFFEKICWVTIWSWRFPTFHRTNCWCYLCDQEVLLQFCGRLGIYGRDMFGLKKIF